MILLDDIEEEFCALFPTETGARMMKWKYNRFNTVRTASMGMSDVTLEDTRFIFETIAEREEEYATISKFTERPKPPGYKSRFLPWD